MNRQEKIELLATKVMGWESKLARPDNISWDWFGWYDGEKLIVKKDKWNPYESWNDAGMIADKIEGLYLYHLSDGWAAYYSRDVREFGKGDTAQEAICEAALKVIE